MVERYEPSQEETELDFQWHVAHEEWLDSLTPDDLIYGFEWRWEWALTDPYDWCHRGAGWGLALLQMMSMDCKPTAPDSENPSVSQK